MSFRGERNWNAKPKHEVVPYTEWEDYKLGLFGNSIDPDKREKYVSILKSPDALREWMSRGADKCPVRWSIVLKSRMNYQAWLGAIAGCLYCGANDATTRNAWSYLTPEEQEAANSVADQVKEEKGNA